MAAPLRLAVLEVEAFTRPVSFRFPFRFGAARVEAADQAFLRLRVRTADGREGEGWAAEMLMPKWFDKDPARTPDDNVADLKRSLRLAMRAIAEGGEGTAFGLHAAIEDAHHAACAAIGLNGLIASFGLALVDRAVIDALARLEGAPAVELVRANALGITSATARDLAGFDLNAFLATLVVPKQIAVRHTVGLGDALDAREIAGTPLGDGLPQTLPEVITAYGHQRFKLKLSGDIPADIDRLERIVTVLESRVPDYSVTLDGNEQFSDAAHVVAFLEALEVAPMLEGLRQKILFLEQPIARARALSERVDAIAGRVAVEIDESDGDIDAFPRARDLGYRGISAKSCKGFYRAVLNRARIAQWNAETDGRPFFMSAEDLTTQAGLAVQQDLVLAGLVDATHVERNGHHFVDGFAGASKAEQARWHAAHPDLYQLQDGRVRLRIVGGRIDLGSTADAAALGTACEPEIDTLDPMHFTEETRHEP